MHRTESKIDKVLFSGENENLRFSIFDFKNAWMAFLKQVLNGLGSTRKPGQIAAQTHRTPHNHRFQRRRGIGKTKTEAAY